MKKHIILVAIISLSASLICCSKDAQRTASTEKIDPQLIEGMTTTASGLHYRVIKEGEGKSPTINDKVTVHYTGKFPNGKVFDSSVDRGQPATFGVKQVIAGWTEGLQLMKPGAQYEFVIPGKLAYGKRGTRGIPANATLVFEVELISVQ